jgi:hypothetical protein
LGRPKLKRARAEAEASIAKHRSACRGRQTDKLRTGHDLLFHDDKLTYEERKELWNLLQYVMSSPKTDLAPAKSKLIAIKIQNAAEPIKDFVTDFLAKYAAEMSK